MTKVQLRFRLVKPLDDSLLGRLADAHAIYGIARIRVEPALDALTVDYDATRLQPPDVEAALAGAGIAVERL